MKILRSTIIVATVASLIQASSKVDCVESPIQKQTRGKHTVVRQAPFLVIVTGHGVHKQELQTVLPAWTLEKHAVLLQPGILGHESIRP